MASFEYVDLGSATILFVDDDPILREFARVHLATDTAAVELASDGAQGYAMACDGRYDLILTDLEMPVLDGFGLIKRLRENSVTRHTPVLVQTSREDVASIDWAYRAGADGFVTKPLNWRLLSYQIAFALRAARMQRDLMAYGALRRAAG
ncbi:MAG: PleD family two-component system response regulator [Brevundimonas sp.]|uniref:response regulator n=1 Tax=Brevundimonas sp. TaxID=1871086 RepID=UPI00391B6163